MPIEATSPEDIARMTPLRLIPLTCSLTAVDSEIPSVVKGVVARAGAR